MPNQNTQTLRDRMLAVMADVNAQVAERFLKENNGFEPMKIDCGIQRCIDEPEHMLTMTPFSGASDGFFAARFRKCKG